MASLTGSKGLRPPTLVGAACLSLIALYGCNSSTADVAERAKAIIVEQLDVGADRVVESARLVEDLGTDSLDCVELVLAFEEEFGIAIPDDAAERMLTVGDAVRVIENARPSK
jgi:acyl carrier protein